MHLGGGDIAIIASAAFTASAINAVGGGGSLLSFPALLLVGVPALVANISNTIGLVPGYAGASIGYRHELRGQGVRIGWLSLAGGGGAVVGAFLLTRTSPAVFEALIPWFILAACALLAAQPAVARFTARSERQGGIDRSAFGVAVLLTGVYAAFFAAGLGVMLLAVLAVFVRDRLQRLNALKGVLSLVFNVVAAAYFIFFGTVAWSAVAVMLPASFVGGFAGVAVARRVPDTGLRLAVIALGLAVSVRLLV
ncbi:MAG: sulfite exporter TauE/SafE family protein [Candidatus Dormibacteria bacterium]